MKTITIILLVFLSGCEKTTFNMGRKQNCFDAGGTAYYMAVDGGGSSLCVFTKEKK